MKLYAAFDLHSRSSHLGVLDEQGRRVLGGGSRGGTFFQEWVSPSSYFLDRSLT